MSFAPYAVTGVVHHHLFSPSFFIKRPVTKLKRTNTRNFFMLFPLEIIRQKTAYITFKTYRMKLTFPNIPSTLKINDEL